MKRTKRELRLAAGSVYFIQAGPGGPIKIGWARSPERRLADLQVASAEVLVLLAAQPGVPEDEPLLHGRFADLRIRGEWFRPDERLLEHIADVDRSRPRTPRERLWDRLEAVTIAGDFVEAKRVLRRLKAGEARS